MRRQILTALKKQGSLSVDDLSRCLGITPMGIRQHLAVLERDNLVMISSVRRGMGRPSYLYRLTELAQEAFPKHYADFAIALLHDIGELDGRDKISLILQRRSEEMTRQWLPRMEGKKVRERLLELYHIYEERGSMPEWEETADNYVFRVYNCGIQRVSREFPEICQYELRMISRLLDLEVERKSCMSKGDDVCFYLIKRNGSQPT